MDFLNCFREYKAVKHQAEDHDHIIAEIKDKNSHEMKPLNA
jgi:hypothetical protein